MICDMVCYDDMIHDMMICDMVWYDDMIHDMICDMV